ARMTPTNSDYDLRTVYPVPRFNLPAPGLSLDGPVPNKEWRVLVLRLADEEFLERSVVVVVEADEDRRLGRRSHVRNPSCPSAHLRSTSSGCPTSICRPCPQRGPPWAFRFCLMLGRPAGSTAS